MGPDFWYLGYFRCGGHLCWKKQQKFNFRPFFYPRTYPGTYPGAYSIVPWFWIFWAFAKVNAREIFPCKQFAKVYAREKFTSEKFAKVYARESFCSRKFLLAKVSSLKVVSYTHWWRENWICAKYRWSMKYHHIL